MAPDVRLATAHDRQAPTPPRPSRPRAGDRASDRTLSGRSNRRPLIDIERSGRPISAAATFRLEPMSEYPATTFTPCISTWSRTPRMLDPFPPRSKRSTPPCSATPPCSDSTTQPSRSDADLPRLAVIVRPVQRRSMAADDQQDDAAAVLDEVRAVPPETEGHAPAPRSCLRLPTGHSACPWLMIAGPPAASRS